MYEQIGVAFDDDDARRTPCAANNTALDRPVSAADHHQHLDLVSSYIGVLLSGRCSRCTLDDWCSVGGLRFSTNRLRIYIYIKNLTPSYGRNTTATTLLSQPNTIILVDAFSEPFMPERCSGT
jgi:hypothetical protein